MESERTAAGALAQVARITVVGHVLFSIEKVVAVADDRNTTARCEKYAVFLVGGHHSSHGRPIWERIRALAMQTRAQFVG